jgi:hypothetical protein
MQDRVGDRVPSDYASALGRDPVLAPPTCCCCCCCCCTLVVPEATFGKSWANQVIQTYAKARVIPPLGTVMKAYAGGIVAGNLIFWIAAVIVGTPLVLVTVGVYLAAVPLALLVTLGIQGGLLGARLSKSRGESPDRGGTVGAFVGIGMGVLVLASIVGLIVVGLFLFGLGVDVLFTPFTPIGLAGLVGAVAVLVVGIEAKRSRPWFPPAPPMRPPPPQPPAWMPPKPPQQPAPPLQPRGRAP